MNKSNIAITIVGLIIFVAAAIAGLVRSEIWTRTSSEFIAIATLVILGIIGIGYFTISSVKKKFRYVSILRKKYGQAYFCQVEYDIQSFYALVLDKDMLRVFTTDKKMTEVWSSHRNTSKAEIVEMNLNGVKKGNGIQITANELSSSNELPQQLRLVMLDDSTLLSPVLKTETLENIIASIK